MFTLSKFCVSFVVPDDCKLIKEGFGPDSQDILRRVPAACFVNHDIAGGKSTKRSIVFRDKFPPLSRNLSTIDVNAYSHGCTAKLGEISRPKLSNK